MKKVISICFIMLFVAAFNATSAANADSVLPVSKVQAFTTLIINANVSVVLVDNDQSNFEVVGDDAMTRLLNFTSNGDTLVIEPLKRKDLKNSGIIYISANQLKKIQINSKANVKSLSPLQAPSLDVVINGACEFSIHNIGKLNLTGTSDFVLDYTSESRSFPASMLRDRKAK
jgi:hypothetical protein